MIIVLNNNNGINSINANAINNNNNNIESHPNPNPSNSFPPQAPHPLTAAPSCSRGCSTGQLTVKTSISLRCRRATTAVSQPLLAISSLPLSMATRLILALLS
jgi:hypothetical protein